MSDHFIAVGNDELGETLELRAGDMIGCPKNCGSMHAITESTPVNTLQFITCGKSTYIIGINGRKIKDKAK